MLYPERMFRLGVGFLLAVFIAGIVIFEMVLHECSLSPLSFSKRTEVRNHPLALSFSLDLKQEPTSFLYPNVEGELALEMEKERPVGGKKSEKFWVKAKRSGAVRKVTLPSRIDLCYRNSLGFSDEWSPFWAEIGVPHEGKSEVRVWAKSEKNEGELLHSFSLRVEEPVYRSATDFPEESPFRALAQGRFLGRDLLTLRYGSNACYRIEVGKEEILSVREGDLLEFSEGKWNKVENLVKESGVRVAICRDREIVLEGWKKEEYVRLLLALATPPPFKTKAEGLLSAVRIRSEKQISCMLEKQCLILQEGDWVIKGDLRWKILRKPEEKSSFLSHQTMGEILVFDGLIVKGGQKKVQASLFNFDHSQIFPIETETNMSHRRSKEMPLKKKEG